MEPNESNLKPQPTGGLKLMTVFVVVLALHVIGIGGVTTYYLLKGGSADSELLSDNGRKTVTASTDGTITGDSSLPTPSDKTVSTTITDAAGTPPAPTDSAAPATIASTTPAPTPAVSNATLATGIPLHTGLASAPPEPVTPPAPDVTEAPATTAPAPDALAATTPAPATDGTPYVVKAKDSLARIAHANHTTVAKLKAANSLNTDLLRIGQKLVIPAKAPAAVTAVAATTPDAPTGPISSMDVVTPTPKVKPAKVAKTAVAAATVADNHTYTVMKGDTLTKIAHKFKTTPTAIMTANNITDAAKLSIGKKLKIPSKEARSAKNTEPAAAPPAPSAVKPSTAQLANVDQQ